MDLLVVPPFTDFTAELLPPSRTELLDLNEHLHERLAAPSALRASAETLPDGPALFARAAAAVLERKAFDDAHLRTVDAALRLAGDPALRLTVDGLELAEGSTQSSRDVLGAAGRCELFRPEIALALEAARGRRAHVVVDGARQLPAAFALVRALGAERVTLCGRLVARHAAALRRVPELAGVGWSDWSPERVIRAMWHVRDTDPAGRVRWVSGTRRSPENGPWAGRLDATVAAAFPKETLARCRGLTIIVTRIDFLAAVTGVTGMTVSLSRVLSAIPDDVPVTCELVVGAPGMDARVVGESLELLADGAGGVRLAGLRPFRMGIRAAWAGRSVRFPPRMGDDLVRWIDFDAPDTMRGYEVTALIDKWLARLPGLRPGRLAACAVAAPPSRPGMGERPATAARGGTGEQPAARGGGSVSCEPPAWDPCAEVVAGTGADGRGPGTFAVSLRSWRSVRLHPALAGPVTRMAADDPRALDDLTEPARRRLTAELTAGGVPQRSEI
ncbi:hypothetical protein ABZ897_17830 [Nonomuraea sp. NPDC046802]|uniref:hypothetical protein n=1 Tax=Nonomuraea sp. NPDC046802 TaxID=3154919 RepID=UPI0033E9DAC8